MIILGHPPSRIDFLNQSIGLSFDEAYERHVLAEIDGIPFPMISLEDLITTKRASGRPQDLLDLEILTRKKQRDDTP